MIAYVKHEFTSREYSGQNNRKGRTSCDVGGPGHPCSMRHGCRSAWMTWKRPGQRTCTLSRMWYWHRTGLCGHYTLLIGARWHSGSCAERPPRQNSEYWGDIQIRYKYERDHQRNPAWIFGCSSSSINPFSNADRAATFS